MNENRIDIVSVFEKKGIKLPGIIARRVESFLQIPVINKYLEQERVGIDFCKGVLEYFDVSIEVNGLENVADDGTRYTFVSNHPLGGLDGMALTSVIGEKFGCGIKCFVNDFLMCIKGMSGIFVPVNKTGAQARDLAGLVDKVFSSDNHILVFPAGLCSRMIDGKIQDLPWSKMFVRKSIETQRSIVPIHFIGQNSPRFYRIARLGKCLGFKVNPAMAFLPDEMVRASHSKFRIVFGKPIPFSYFDKSRTAAQWAQWLRSEVYSL